MVEVSVHPNCKDPRAFVVAITEHKFKQAGNEQMNNYETDPAI